VIALRDGIQAILSPMPGRLLKNTEANHFVKEHEFSRADKPCVKSCRQLHLIEV
jgi:hypothetical protein